MIQLQSRLTKLPGEKPPVYHLTTKIEKDVWVLRDDELGGFWGTKFRKYAAITNYCKSNGVTQIVATGGVSSNNLAAAAVLCAEAGLSVKVFAVEDHHSVDIGNKLLLKLALSSENLCLVARAEKESIPQKMKEYAASKEKEGVKCLVLEEGGACRAAVRGCLTLADDILRARTEWSDGQPPAHIFVDSGTGLSAAALVCGIYLSQPKTKIKIHIVQMAGKESELEDAFSRWVTPETNIHWKEVSELVQIYRPLKPRSYGATSAELFEFIRNMARHTGLLLDPIYTGKLFMKSFDIMKDLNSEERKLIVHTGGVSGLMGFPQINA